MELFCILGNKESIDCRQNVTNNRLFFPYNKNELHLVQLKLGTKYVSVQMPNNPTCMGFLSPDHFLLCM